jgi:hypothetical protein
MIAETMRLKYAVVIALRDALRDAGIECGETVGGVRIYPVDAGQESAAVEICATFGAYTHDGDVTRTVEFREAMRAECKPGSETGAP